LRVAEGRRMATIRPIHFHCGVPPPPAENQFPAFNRAGRRRGNTEWVMKTSLDLVETDLPGPRLPIDLIRLGSKGAAECLVRLQLHGQILIGLFRSGSRKGDCRGPP